MRARVFENSEKLDNPNPNLRTTTRHLKKASHFLSCLSRYHQIDYGFENCQSVVFLCALFLSSINLVDPRTRYHIIDWVNSTILEENKECVW